MQMLTGGDDYPIHEAPEPVALVTDRNFYDRYFFNGYSPDGDLFFAAAMGFYPALDVVDGAFCVAMDGVQYNLRASARLNGERMVLRVGPIAIEICEPLNRLRITVAANDGPLSADLTFTGRHFPIEEPRFTRRVGTRLYMDYTRLTQNGGWSGWVDVAGNGGGGWLRLTAAIAAGGRAAAGKPDRAEGQQQQATIKGHCGAAPVQAVSERTLQAYG